METLALIGAVMIALLHGSYVVVFLYLITVSLRGKLRSFPIGLYLFWIWIVGKIASHFLLGECIFTQTEQYLRELSGRGGYNDGFIEHYARMLGIELSYTAIWWIVMVPLSTAILSETYWWWRRRMEQTVS